MSKRKNFQSKRRQVRRALNRALDAFTKLGVSKARRVGYGTGLTRKMLVEHRER